MRTFVLPTIAWLTLYCSVVCATDLTKIDRSIAKEPAYQMKPQYCLLVFGSEAKTRVWLVLDGDILYVDRNGNGDLTEPGERIAKLNVESKGKVVAHRFAVGSIPAAGGDPAKQSLSIPAFSGDEDFKVVFEGQYRQVSDGEPLRFAEHRAKAPVLQFSGPLTFMLASQTSLERSGGMLSVSLGTPGLGPGTYARVVPITAPKHLHPVAELEFPNRNKGGPPIKLKVSLAPRQEG